MTSNVIAFKADLAKLSKILDADIAKLLQFLAFDLWNKITQRNPVDTGYSRSQWHINLGSPDTSVGTKPGRGTTIDLPLSDLARLSGVTKDSIIFVTNSVDYIQYLEEGSSQQAPSGMIRVSIAEVESDIDAYIAKAVSEGFRG